MTRTRGPKRGGGLKWGLYLHGRYIQPVGLFPTKRAAEVEQAKEHAKGNQAVVMRL